MKFYVKVEIGIGEKKSTDSKMKVLGYNHNSYENIGDASLVFFKMLGYEGELLEKEIINWIVEKKEKFDLIKFKPEEFFEEKEK